MAAWTSRKLNSIRETRCSISMDLGTSLAAARGARTVDCRRCGTGGHRTSWGPGLSRSAIAALDELCGHSLCVTASPLFDRSARSRRLGGIHLRLFPEMAAVRAFKINVGVFQPIQVDRHTTPLTAFRTDGPQERARHGRL